MLSSLAIMSPSPNAGWQRYISAVRLLQVMCPNQLMFTSLATQELQFLKSGVEALFFWKIVCYSQNAQSRVNVCFLYFWFFTWMSDLHTLAHGFFFFFSSFLGWQLSVTIKFDKFSQHAFLAPLQYYIYLEGYWVSWLTVQFKMSQYREISTDFYNFYLFS